MGEYVVEATSERVNGDLAQRGAPWDECHDTTCIFMIDPNCEK
jgi:hypothetical protein